VTLTRRVEGQVLVLEPAGAGADGLAEDLTAAWRDLDEDDEIRLAVLDMSRLDGSSRWQSLGLDAFPLHATKPVIAAIEGNCHGRAFELALACDLRVAGEGSRFGFPDAEADVAYRVASVLLPRITFAGLSLELLLGGRVLDAREAQAARLVNRVTEDGRALGEALGIADTILGRVTGDFRKQRILGFSGVPLVTAMRTAREG
jgi:enoyl-CoA hydratase/carnithine racemase